ncbi:MAG: hypothetical protein UY31_C0016G0015 [Candidatus Wolfebacteria bacterium GW2011_GWE1_48_7]|uniref:Uncharacterized protein n=2 Tax=Candidatus Wolfeibacteriota TaxID=1752735 RepID=A0A0G1X4H4_9BACT|nr:MAG: hypothetical protein UX70_C0001G0153 [Candidatus Wolfebacteria bacterium GW2011_GWB1_47_1]KKU36741.1 MAG: hypothetical protein UX49_C0010G0037 [Candidatus Wolfebacteria bacterium GW2011_GWC2_46_275]KKU41963.1 MAG: hypothetical protein UX58_C0004G0022 [Candidatus Wolfebacteria bacterium GW2011_GWB2_46_69]KKU54501.1 MAG: hypothetical protein UX76_C0002G0094 [Candidatus Wolfebacteria bacterium GW2011_GWC1_47_103]KKU59828.1 MAG: hypothetical protein UX83_C0002G0115 [Candidatus Wolfebacteria
MKKIDIRKHTHLLFGFFCGVLLVGVYVAGSMYLGIRSGSSVVSAAIPALTEPSADPFVRGWAWSSNIGWINFDCRDLGTCATSSYSTRLNLATGRVAGGPNEHWAWSSTIGWIDTNPTAGYPEAPNHGLRVDIPTGVISGWMRACAGAANISDVPPSCTGGSVDGWDGWIKVMDAKVTQRGYIKNNAETDGGWMWGGDVIGWVKTWIAGDDGVYFPAADCAFGIDPASITPPQSVTLAWKCNQLVTANTCSIDHGVGTNLPATGNRNANPAEATTYTLTCQGLGGPAIKTVSIAVSGKVRIIEVPAGQ